MLNSTIQKKNLKVTVENLRINMLNNKGKQISIEVTSRGGDSHMEQTGMLVRNFEFKP